MSKTLDDMFRDMLENPGVFGGYSSTSADRFYNDEESEDFITSEDMVKMKENNDPNADLYLPKGPIEIEESLHFKRYSKRREHKYTETEMEEIRKSCEATIVHDYSENDRYHQSDEERARDDSLNEMTVKLSGLKRMYRKIDQYIVAMRTVIEAWELIEKKENYLHTRKEFFKMVHDGRIYHTRIIMPKMKGLDKYNIDMVIQYISNPELDPKDLIANSQQNMDSFYDDLMDEDTETAEEEMERLLSPEEVQYILDHADNPEMIKVHDIKKKRIKGYDHRTFTSKNKKKRLPKSERIIRKDLHEMLNKIQSNPYNRDMDTRYYNRSALLTNSMFEPAEDEKSFFDDIRFDGSWASKDDLFLYDLAIEEAMASQHIPGEYMTYGDREIAEFFNVMEREGMNVIELRRRMNATGDDINDKQVKNKQKYNKKMESIIIQRITKLNGNSKFKKLINKAEKEINEEE